MPSWAPTFLGLIAGTCSTAAFVPQVVKIWREGDTHAISTRMYSVRVFGFSLWLLYGFGMGSPPLMIFNTLSILLGGTILWLKLHPGEPHG